MSTIVCPTVLAKIEKATAHLCQQIQDETTKIVTNEVAKQKLTEAGIPFYEGTLSYTVIVECDVLEEKTEFIKKVYGVLGRLKEFGDKDVVDTRRHIVRVKLGAVQYPGVRIKYLHKLDRSSKCKIVKAKTSKEKVRTYHTLVCAK